MCPLWSLERAPKGDLPENTNGPTLNRNEKQEPHGRARCWAVSRDQQGPRCSGWHEFQNPMWTAWSSTWNPPFWLHTSPKPTSMGLQTTCSSNLLLHPCLPSAVSQLSSTLCHHFQRRSESRKTNQSAASQKVAIHDEILTPKAPIASEKSATWKRILT